MLTGSQRPLLVRTGPRNWNRKTVPVGRILIRSPAPVSDFCLREVVAMLKKGFLILVLMQRAFEDIFKYLVEEKKLEKKNIV